MLSVLNSGLYTASRMLVVLPARREVPIGLMTVGKSSVPWWAILISSVIGFICVIAAAISPDQVFYFLINSIGPIILIVYLLTAISQVVLRRRTSPQKLVVKIWLFPVLSILAILAILAVVVQMALAPDLRIQLILSLLVFALTVAVYFIARKVLARPLSVATEAEPPAAEPARVLVLANETVERPGAPR